MYRLASSARRFLSLDLQRRQAGKNPQRPPSLMKEGYSPVSGGTPKALPRRRTLTQEGVGFQARLGKSSTQEEEVVSCSYWRRGSRRAKAVLDPHVRATVTTAVTYVAVRALHLLFPARPAQVPMRLFWFSGQLYFLIV